MELRLFELLSQGRSLLDGMEKSGMVKMVGNIIWPNLSYQYIEGSYLKEPNYITSFSALGLSTPQYNGFKPESISKKTSNSNQYIGIRKDQNYRHLTEASSPE